MKYRHLFLLAPLVATALLGVACSQAGVRPAPLGDCLDPSTCNPPTTDGSSKDVAQDTKPVSDAKADAVSSDAGDAGDGANDAADADGG